MRQPSCPERWIGAAALLAMAILLSTTDAMAETSAQFEVSAKIEAGCSIDGFGASGHAGSFGTLDFGTDSTFSTAMRTATIMGSQSIVLRCTPGISLAMAVDGGAHAIGGVRAMQHSSDPSERIAYTICRDAACAQPIAIGGSTGIAITGAVSEDVPLPLYASLTLPGSMRFGTYGDTLMVTLTW